MPKKIKPAVPGFDGPRKTALESIRLFCAADRSPWCRNVRLWTAPFMPTERVSSRLARLVDCFGSSVPTARAAPRVATWAAARPGRTTLI